MLRLPPAAGPITASLFEHLGGAGGPIAAIPPEPDALGDRDFQLALYVANELHYGAVEGVDDGLEWDPKISALRTALGQGMVNRLLAECEQPEPVSDPRKLPHRIFDLVAEDDSPPLSRYLETKADLRQFREFVIHRSAYQLKEADPHRWSRSTRAR